MATNVTAAFEKKYSREVFLACQQKKSKLEKAVSVVRGVRASTYDFHYMGTVTANTKSRDGDVTPLNPAQSVKTATLADSYALIRLDKLDEFKTNAMIRQGYVDLTVSALNRKRDSVVVAALDAATPGTTVTAGSGLTYEKVLEALTALNAQDVDPEDRFIVVSPEALEDALTETKFTSGDYVTGLRGVMDGTISRALGFNWILSTLLNTSGSPATRQCYAFSKRAVGLVISGETDKLGAKIEWSTDKQAWNIVGMQSIGSVVIEPNALVQIDVTE